MSTNVRRNIVAIVLLTAVLIVAGARDSYALFPGAKITNCTKVLDLSGNPITQCFGSCDPNAEPINDANQPINYQKSCPGQNITNQNFTVSITFDPANLTDNTAGVSSSSNNALWNLFFPDNLPQLQTQINNLAPQAFSIGLNQSYTLAAAQLIFSVQSVNGKACVYVNAPRNQNALNNSDSEYDVGSRYPATVSDVQNSMASVPPPAGSTPTQQQNSELKAMPGGVSSSDNCVSAPLPAAALQPPAWGALISPVCTDYTLAAAHWLYPFTSVVVECIADSFLNIFNVNASSSSFFSTIQNSLKSMVRAALALFIIFTGYQLMIGKNLPERADWTKRVIRIALVIYFSIGSGMVTWFPQAWIVSTDLSLMVMEAGLGYPNPASDPVGYTAMQNYQNAITALDNLEDNISTLTAEYNKDLANITNLQSEISSDLSQIATDTANLPTFLNQKDTCNSSQPATGPYQNTQADLNACKAYQAAQAQLTNDQLIQKQLQLRESLVSQLGTSWSPTLLSGDLSQLENVKNPCNSSDAPVSDLWEGTNNYENTTAVINDCSALQAAQKAMNTAYATEQNDLNTMNSAQAALNAASGNVVSQLSAAQAQKLIDDAALAAAAASLTGIPSNITNWYNAPQGNIVTNGGVIPTSAVFGTPALTSGNGWTVSGGFWGNSASEICGANGSLPPAPGNGCSVEMAAATSGFFNTPPNVITQTLTTVPGEQVAFSFYYSPLTSSTSLAQNQVTVNVNGGALLSTVVPTNGNNNPGWVQETFTFTATSNSTTISFSGSNTPSGGVINGAGLIADIDVQRTPADITAATQAYNNAQGGNTAYAAALAQDNADITLIATLTGAAATYNGLVTAYNNAKTNYGNDVTTYNNDQTTYNNDSSTYNTDLNALSTLKSQISQLEQIAQIDKQLSYTDANSGFISNVDNSGNVTCTTTCNNTPFELCNSSGGCTSYSNNPSANISSTDPNLVALIANDQQSVAWELEAYQGQQSLENSALSAIPNLTAQLYGTYNANTIPLAPSTFSYSCTGTNPPRYTGNTGLGGLEEQLALAEDSRDNINCQLKVLNSELGPDETTVTTEYNNYIAVKASDPKIAAIGYDYCDFRFNQYPAGKDYDKLWDMVDCKISKYLGIGALSSAPAAPMSLLIVMTSLLSSAYGILIMAFGMTFIVFIVMFIIRVVHIYIMAFISLVMLVFISPIIIPMILFKFTESIFERWLREFIAMLIQPVILFAFLSFALFMFDTVIYGGNKHFDQNSNIILNNGQCDDPNTIACVFSTLTFNQIEPIPIIPKLVITYPNYSGGSDQVVFMGMLQVLLICFIVSALLEQVQTLSTQIAESGSQMGANTMSNVPMANPTQIMGSLGAIGHHAVKGTVKTLWHAPSTVAKSIKLAGSGGASLAKWATGRNTAKRQQILKKDLSKGIN